MGCGQSKQRVSKKNKILAQEFAKSSPLDSLSQGEDATDTKNFHPK
jgi:hypothetical protein